jgi:hypothetical protein
MSVEKISSNIAGYINKSKGAQRVLKGIGENPAIFSAVASFGLASVMRPLVTEALPFKNEKDKKCSQASAISSGLMDLVATAAIFIPLNKSIEKASANLYSKGNAFYMGNDKAISQFKSLTNRGIKLLLVAPINAARMYLIKPLMKNVLGADKSNKGEKRKLNKWA